MHYAMYTGNCLAAKRLWDAGGDPNIADNTGKTPMNVFPHWFRSPPVRQEEDTD